MKKLMKNIGIFFMFIMLVVIFPVNTAADFGNFAGDSDYGGSSDYSYSSGGGYSSSSGYNSDYSSDLDWATLPLAMVLFVILMIYTFIEIKMEERRKRKGQKQKQWRSQVQNPGAAPTTGLQSLRLLKQRDPDFSEFELKERLSKLYVQMQNCWTNKDITPLRGDFTDSQFAQYDRQLQQYRDNNQTSMVERIAVLDVNIRGLKSDSARDILIVNLSTRIVEYTVDDKTGTIVRGNKTKEKFMQYEWTLVRPKGTKTIAQSKDSALNCPNCSAPLDINKSAQCPYCGSIVSKVEHDWVIAEIKGLSQRTS